VTVTTVLGEVDAADLGQVDAHEHIFLKSPVLPGDEFQDLLRMGEEVNAVKASGIDTIVDLTPIGLGRRPAATAELSRSTGVHVVLATGVHRRAHYPAGHWVYEIGVEELRELFLTDLTVGIDDRDWQGPTPRATEVRAGIIKLGASYHSIHAAERVWMAAGAQAAVETGVPIAVHCEVGTAAHEILDRLQADGVPPDQVMLAHLDRNLDPSLHSELAERGAYLGYDTIGRTKYHADSAILDLIAGVIGAGHGGRILLGTDVGRKTMLTSYGGGPGMDVLGRTFLPRLLDRFGEDLARQVMVENPAQFLGRRDRRS
jgi:predicted metal-dependent phosphotriesterase family hydrolase